MSRDPKQLADQIQAAADSGRSRPPLEAWHPELSGDIDIRILRDGTWLYQGEPLKRAAIAQLFSTILRRENDGDYYLVTPVEKWRIQVEDAPLLAHGLEREGEGSEQQLWLTTNMDERLPVGADHPLSVGHYPNSEEPRPVIRVRHGLEARLTTATFYDLAEQVVEQDGQGYGIWSGGEFFPLG
ncbi:DUF1285 domain-containing protein [Marinobacter xestospongiae]|uniref:DUF1285 domain-containing protein n=1 Tax=Marinobacter xestospongiae TaxID=994319 RepID=A0ABU3W022_9GAMM|nr:DUF1285 domain-containing protein [Marinobacter xestospongiae]MDV2079887.1 DUF1285 domain-containing protein [Marinobacter xestospongiae]